MTDPELSYLVEITARETHPLEHPPAAALGYISGLQLTEEDLKMLLGDAPGLSWVNMKEDVAAFFARLRFRAARLVCNDEKLKDSVKKAIDEGADATWVALVAAFRFAPTAVLARCLKPLAAALIVSGVSKLCVKNGKTS